MFHKILLLLTIIFCSFFILSCENLADYSQPEFSVKAISRSNQIYVEWTPPNKTVFSTIKLSIKTNSDKSNFADYNISSEQNSYIFSELSNETEYSIVFYAVDSNNIEYRKELDCTPNLYSVTFDRATAIVYDGKLCFSWAYKSSKNVSNINIYYKNERIQNTKVLPSEAYEEISDSSGDEIQTYDEYYFCIIDDETFAKGDKEFELRAVSKNGEESSPAFCVKSTAINLPVVELYTENSEPVISKEKVDATFSLNNCTQTIKKESITIKGRGNSSWENAPKKSYTIKFETGQSVFDMPKHKSYALIANYFDKTLLRNQTSYAIGRDIYTNMTWNPKSQSIHLFLNNIYQGIYNIVQTNKIDSTRINIPNLEDCTTPDEFYKYGYLLEANWREDESFNFTTDKGIIFSLKEPDGNDISEELKTLIKEKIQSIEDEIFSDNLDNIDINSFVDWYIVNEFAKNPDSNFYSSCYMYYNPTDNKIHMGPLWDFDLGYGNINLDTSSEGFKTATEPSDGKYNNWIVKLMQNPIFLQKVKTRYNETKDLLKNYFEQDYVTNANSLLVDCNVNFTRWPILGKKVWKSPSGYEERTAYQDEIDYFINWTTKRLEWLDTELTY